jgi:hypothetical protein
MSIISSDDQKNATLSWFAQNSSEEIRTGRPYFPQHQCHNPRLLDGTPYNAALPNDDLCYTEHPIFGELPVSQAGKFIEGQTARRWMPSLNNSPNPRDSDILPI